MNRVRRLLVIVLLTGLVGCAGVPVDFGKARTVEVGMTASKLESIMGKPYMVRAIGDREIWAWVQASAFSTQSVSFELRKGVVSVVPTIPSSF